MWHAPNGPAGQRPVEHGTICGQKCGKIHAHAKNGCCGIYELLNSRNTIARKITVIGERIQTGALATLISRTRSLECMAAGNVNLLGLCIENRWHLPERRVKG